MNCLIARVAQYGADLAGRGNAPISHPGASSGCWRSIQVRAICQTAFEGWGRLTSRRRARGANSGAERDERVPGRGDRGIFGYADGFFTRSVDPGTA
jgi:hypothetical protein